MDHGPASEIAAFVARLGAYVHKLGALVQLTFPCAEASDAVLVCVNVLLYARVFDPGNQG